LLRTPKRGGQGPIWAVETYDDDDDISKKLSLLVSPERNCHCLCHQKESVTVCVTRKKLSLFVSPERNCRCLCHQKETVTVCVTRKKLSLFVSPERNSLFVSPERNCHCLCHQKGTVTVSVTRKKLSLFVSPERDCHCFCHQWFPSALAVLNEVFQAPRNVHRSTRIVTWQQIYRQIRTVDPG
jgi:hypothetical protein